MNVDTRFFALGLALLASACQAPLQDALATGTGAGAAPRFEVQRVDAATVSAADAAAVEADLLGKINAVRAEAGVGPLTASSELREIAMAHIDDMQTRRYFSHQTPDGKSPYERMQATGIAFSATGETISHPHVGGNTAKAIIDDWRRHPGGWSQVIDGRFTMAGVAVRESGPSEYLVTVIYLRPSQTATETPTETPTETTTEPTTESPTEETTETPTESSETPEE